MTANAFYNHENGAFVPTGHGVSPWNPKAQMGVAVAGLIGHVMDDAPSPAPMVTTRLTIDILGAVPLEPLTAQTRIVREGRRMQVLETELSQGGRAWVRATALRVRIGASPLAEPAPTRHFPDPLENPGILSESALATTLRIQGGFPHPGPGAWWVKPNMRVVAETPISPLVAVAMVSDFGSGTAPLVSPETWTFANVDISIHLTRPPRGDWLLVDAVSESAGNGIGVAHTRLGDREGMIGMAHQTVFLDPR